MLLRIAQKNLGKPTTIAARPSALLTDLYQINMIQAYLDHGETKIAVFEFFAGALALPMPMTALGQTLRIRDAGAMSASPSTAVELMHHRER